MLSQNGLAKNDINRFQSRYSMPELQLKNQSRTQCGESIKAKIIDALVNSDVPLTSVELSLLLGYPSRTLGGHASRLLAEKKISKFEFHCFSYWTTTAKIIQAERDFMAAKKREAEKKKSELAGIHEKLREEEINDTENREWFTKIKADAAAKAALKAVRARV